MHVPPELLSTESWEASGFPPERALLALFASMSAEEAEAMLRRMLAGAVEEFDASPPDPKYARNRQALLPGAVVVSRDDDDWEFAGGVWLEEAVGAIEASVRLHRVPAKSLSHALAAAQAVVSAVIELRDFQRDPAGWRQHLAEFRAAEDDPRAMISLGARSKERIARKAEDARDIWARFLPLAIGTVANPG